MKKNPEFKLINTINEKKTRVLLKSTTSKGTKFLQEGLFKLRFILLFASSVKVFHILRIFYISKTSVDLEPLGELGVIFMNNTSIILLFTNIDRNKWKLSKTGTKSFCLFTIPVKQSVLFFLS